MPLENDLVSLTFIKRLFILELSLDWTLAIVDEPLAFPQTSVTDHLVLFLHSSLQRGIIYKSELIAMLETDYLLDKLSKSIEI